MLDICFLSSWKDSKHDLNLLICANLDWAEYRSARSTTIFFSIISVICFTKYLDGMKEISSDFRSESVLDLPQLTDDAHSQSFFTISAFLGFRLVLSSASRYQLKASGVWAPSPKSKRDTIILSVRLWGYVWDFP